MRRTKIPWSESELVYLSNNSHKYTIDRLVATLDRTEDTVRKKIKALGLTYKKKRRGPQKENKGNGNRGKEACEVNIENIVKREREQIPDIDTIRVGHVGKRYKIEVYSHDQRRKLILRRTVKGKLEGIYDRHFVVKDDRGIRESFLKADIIAKFLKVKELDR